MESMNVFELMKEIAGKCNIVEEIYYNDELTDDEKYEIEEFFELMRERFRGEL